MSEPILKELLQPLLEATPEPGVLPEPDAISYYVLERERKIYLDFDVDPSIIRLQRMIMRWNMEDKGKPVEERTPIRLYIMSYGGELDCMWLLIDAIEMSATPVYTYNIGVCGSAASLIFMSGHKRFMAKRAKVIVHEGSASLAGDAVKVMDATDSYRKELKRMKDYILDRTEIPKAQLSKKRNNDWELDAAFCLENHVCDVVISSIEEII